MVEAQDVTLTEDERRLQRRIGLVMRLVSVIVVLFLLGAWLAPSLMTDLGLRPLLDGGWGPLLMVILPLNVMDDAMFAAVLRSRPLLLSAIAAMVLGLLPLINLAGVRLPGLVDLLCATAPFLFVLFLWLTIPAAKAPIRIGAAR